MKKILLLSMLFLLAAPLVFAQVQVNEPIRIEGRTMGTTYSVVYFDSQSRNLKSSIDSLLVQVNRGINTYDRMSVVSTFNASAEGVGSDSDHFLQTLKKSLAVAAASEGHFDPTVMPLVNLWGFGPDKNLQPSQRKIDSIRHFVGYHHISMRHNRVSKDHPNAQVDFGGIGQGYGVDVIANFLIQKKISDYLVELGGEGFASGKNIQTNAPWKVGIVDPMSDKDDQHLLGYITIENGAFTTSGNYFNYRIIDGKKYGHTISPFTGFPIQQDLISVSIFADDCATADAWATACMVAGKEKSIGFLKANPSLAAIFFSMHGGKLEIFVSDNIKDNVFLEQTHDN
ncbi:MAG TPA: FAD:protein FMN transferase [Chryseosolibacter sp.]